MQNMKMIIGVLALSLLLGAAVASAGSDAPRSGATPPPRKTVSTDWRGIRNGLEIPTVNYADQPHVARLDNGTWLCTLTTGSGDEGKPGQFVAVTLSSDRGHTWSPLRPLEDPEGPESAYSTPLVTPSGRVYVFYNYNGEKAIVAREGLRLELTGDAVHKESVPFSYRPQLCWQGKGLTVDIRARFGSLTPGQVLLDSRNEDGAGFWISLNDHGVPRTNIRASDGAEFGWDADAGMILAGKEHRIAFVLDGAARIVSVIVDGRLCDGGSERAFGWARIPGHLNDINPSKRLRLAPSFEGTLLAVRIYDRYLLTSEVFSGHRASLKLSHTDIPRKELP